MRYLVQFAIPVLIFATVVYFAMRVKKRSDSKEDDGRLMFALILAVGAILAAVSLYLLKDYFGV
ncbi:MAG: hypothetical protein O3A63_08825 [Proteobacteria bacterium]|nr:hypothetical protein [Pseudomonadota bacterium]